MGHLLYNPSDKRSAEKNREKKKAAVPHMKPRTIRTVLRIPLTTMPRGKVRKKLTEDGRVQDIKIFRSMASIEVKKAISTGFENVFLEKFYFADNQELNGD